MGAINHQNMGWIIIVLLTLVTKSWDNSSIHSVFSHYFPMISPRHHSIPLYPPFHPHLFSPGRPVAPGWLQAAKCDSPPDRAGPPLCRASKKGQGGD